MHTTCLIKCPTELKPHIKKLPKEVPSILRTEMRIALPSSKLIRVSTSERDGFFGTSERMASSRSAARVEFSLDLFTLLLYGFSSTFSTSDDEPIWRRCTSATVLMINYCPENRVLRLFHFLYLINQQTSEYYSNPSQTSLVDFGHRAAFIVQL